jgi:hypothetical protein
MTRRRRRELRLDSVRRIVSGVLLDSIRQHGTIDESNAATVANRITRSIAGEARVVRAALAPRPTEAQRRTRDNLSAAYAALDRLRAIDVTGVSGSCRGHDRSGHAPSAKPTATATVVPTGDRLWRWRVTRTSDDLFLNDRDTSRHLTRRAAERQAARWVRRQA